MSSKSIAQLRPGDVFIIASCPKRRVSRWSRLLEIFGVVEFDESDVQKFAVQALPPEARPSLHEIGHEIGH